MLAGNIVGTPDAQHHFSTNISQNGAMLILCFTTSVWKSYVKWRSKTKDLGNKDLPERMTHQAYGAFSLT